MYFSNNKYSAYSGWPTELMENMIHNCTENTSRANRTCHLDDFDFDSRDGADKTVPYNGFIPDETVGPAVSSLPLKHHYHLQLVQHLVQLEPRVYHLLYHRQMDVLHLHRHLSLLQLNRRLIVVILQSIGIL